VPHLEIPNLTILEALSLALTGRKVPAMKQIKICYLWGWRRWRDQGQRKAGARARRRWREPRARWRRGGREIGGATEFCASREQGFSINFISLIDTFLEIFEE
jgi:hypothetical protein